MAEEQAAARDRVLAARAELGEQVELLEASARAAVDIPARVRRSPAKAAAIVGGTAFVALKGPQRLFGAIRRRVRGDGGPMPERMLPDEIEKTLRKLGKDGDRVRGALERDFADYAKRAEKDRKGVAAALALAIARPLLARGAKSAAESLLTPNPEGFAARLAQVRGRTEKSGADQATEAGSDRIAAARQAGTDARSDADKPPG